MPPDSNASDGRFLTGIDFAAIILTVFVTFLVSAILAPPRVFLFVAIFTAYVRARGSVMVFPRDSQMAILIFDLLVLTVSLAAGAAAMASARLVFRASDAKRIMVGAVSALMVYAAVMSSIHEQLPGLIPTRMDLAAAIPGWYLGCLAAGGSVMRHRLRWTTILGFLFATLVVALAVGVTPSWVRFNMPCGLKCGQIIPWMEYGPRV